MPSTTEYHVLVVDNTEGTETVEYYFQTDDRTPREVLRKFDEQKKFCNVCFACGHEECDGLLEDEDEDESGRAERRNENIVNYIESKMVSRNIYEPDGIKAPSIYISIVQK